MAYSQCELCGKTLYQARVPNGLQCCGACVNASCKGFGIPVYAPEAAPRCKACNRPVTAGSAVVGDLWFCTESYCAHTGIYAAEQPKAPAADAPAQEQPKSGAEPPIAPDMSADVRLQEQSKADVEHDNAYHAEQPKSAMPHVEAHLKEQARRLYAAFSTVQRTAAKCVALAAAAREAADAIERFKSAMEAAGVSIDVGETEGASEA